ncbi:MAG: hypothetical protein QXJ81_01165, partial [Metallosphaera sp.]
DYKIKVNIDKSGQGEIVYVIRVQTEDNKYIICTDGQSLERTLYIVYTSVFLRDNDIEAELKRDDVNAKVFKDTGQSDEDVVFLFV